MSKKRKPGRRVYYEKRWSSSLAHHRTKAQRTKEDIGRSRLTTPANLEARAKREAHTEDMILNTLRMNRGGDTKAREAALDKLTHYIKLDEMDRHAVIHQGLRTVIIMFYSKNSDRVWFVERNCLTDAIRKSIEYGSISQALSYHETGTITFVA